IAADIERVLAREGAAPERIGVLVGSVAREGGLLASALEERAIPHRTHGAMGIFERSEVRDVLAWLRLLIDPQDSGAVVRVLARAPVELRQVALARVIQIARRRKLDMVAALSAATESPQIPPEARERIRGFLAMHRTALAALDTDRPDLFVYRLIDRLGLRRQQLFAAQAEVVERLRDLARLGDLAADFAQRSPRATARDFATYIAGVSDARLPLGGERGEDPLEEIADISGRPGETGGVRIMEIRAARGLELDSVYVPGLSARGGLDARGGSGSNGLSGADAREDLRLAMSRARERLVLTYVSRGREGAPQAPRALVEEVRGALGAEWEEREEELFGPAEALHATLRMMREEVLAGVARIAGRLGELRLDTELDVSHEVVRHLELVKLAALLERPADQGIAEVLPELNARLLAAMSPLQREIFQSSPLDETLLAAEHSDRARALAIAAREEPSLELFLPRRGQGLVLSASDIETYRSCPLKYKFARVFRIPSEPTLGQRFGIMVHQVLERYHAGVSNGAGVSEGVEIDGALARGTNGSPRTPRARPLSELLGLLEAGWRRGGFGEGEQERQLHEKARRALTRYHERLLRAPADPVWFERSFSFRIGPHQLRGRVDRVDRLLGEGSGEGYELIDYKTGRPKSAAELREDVQLSLYGLAAREAWNIEAERRAYYYVLDDEKVPVSRGEDGEEWVRDAVIEAGEGILGQEFEPTPSYGVCSMCDYRIICPAAEK
ncbi:MAG TPA: PD-(D/E)XK nuclease family protein, partial [Solirubrobacteraceae bacterium]|nr:PD-(D/E)XK nuclease family protein [Solirubrobacteraceae bacterium]